MYGQKDHLCVEIVFPELPDSLDAVENRHRDVDDDDIDAKLASGFRNAPAVGDSRDDPEFVLQKLPDRVQNGGIIIHQEPLAADFSLVLRH